jgi:GntR family transcriptional regulator/MocR family aminotransferase
VDPDTVVVTSAHQFPMGGVLPPGRRDALVRWAAERPAFVIEDDYDAEYRYDRDPIGAIQGLAPERVIYAGTASKVLAPGLRLGWIVSPLDLVDRLARAKEMFDRGSAAIHRSSLTPGPSRLTPGTATPGASELPPRDVLLRSQPSA